MSKWIKYLLKLGPNTFFWVVHGKEWITLVESYPNILQTKNSTFVVFLFFIKTLKGSPLTSRGPNFRGRKGADNIVKPNTSLQINK